MEIELFEVNKPEIESILSTKQRILQIDFKIISKFLFLTFENFFRILSIISFGFQNSIFSRPFLFLFPPSRSVTGSFSKNQMKPSADTGRSTQNQFEVVVDTLVGLFNEGNPAFCLEKEKGILEIRVNQIHHSSLKFFVVQEFFALRSLIQAEFEKILGQKLELIVSHPPSVCQTLKNFQIISAKY